MSTSAATLQGIVVIGAGVNGSVCAARLRDAASTSPFDEINTEGIIIENPLSHRRTATRIKAIGTLLPDDVYDYVLVVVRRNQVGDLLPVLARPYQTGRIGHALRRGERSRHVVRRHIPRTSSF